MPQGSVITLSIGQEQQAAVRGAVRWLRDHTAYKNISSLVVALVLEADRTERMVPVFPKTTLTMLEQLAGDRREENAARSVIAISIPQGQDIEFKKALTRVQERSGQRSRSTLVCNLLLDAALRIHGELGKSNDAIIGIISDPSFESIAISDETLKDLTALSYAGHISTAYKLGRAIYAKISTSNEESGYRDAFLADAYQRVALTFRDYGKLEEAFRAVELAIQHANKEEKSQTQASLLSTSLYRRAGIILQMWQHETSTATQQILLHNAQSNLEEAYQRAQDARRGLREEFGTRLAKVKVLLGAQPEDVKPYIEEALRLFNTSTTAFASNTDGYIVHTIDDESGIIINRPGILHRRAQLSLIYARKGVPVTEETFTLGQARADVIDALRYVPRTMLRWRVDMQLTLAEILLLENNREEAENELRNLFPYVHELNLSRIWERYKTLQQSLN